MSRLAQRGAQVAKRFGIIRLQSQGLAVAGDGLRRVPLLRICDAQEVMGIGAVRPEQDRLAAGLRRLRQPAEIAQHAGKVEMGVRMPGPRCDRRPIACGRCFRLPLVTQGVPEIVVGIGVIRLQRDGCPIADSGFLAAPEIAQRIAQVGAEGRRLRCDRQRPRDQIHGQGRTSGLAGHHPEQMQAVGMRGLGGQDLAIQRLRVGQRTALV